MSKSTALPSIFENALMKLMSDGSMRGNKSGTIMAAMMFDMSVYVVSEAALPPSLPVITAAAVAVGHISMTTMPSVLVSEGVGLLAQEYHNGGYGER